MKKINLLSNIPDNLAEERVEALAIGQHFKIERIISRGHRSEPGFWYDQDWDEWVLVLKGRARLTFEGQTGALDLEIGDSLLIPAGTRHRVAWTDPGVETLWLAVHVSPEPGKFY